MGQPASHLNVKLTHVNDCPSMSWQGLLRNFTLVLSTLSYIAAFLQQIVLTHSDDVTALHQNIQMMVMTLTTAAT